MKFTRATACRCTRISTRGSIRIRRLRELSTCPVSWCRTWPRCAARCSATTNSSREEVCGGAIRPRMSFAGQSAAIGAALTTLELLGAPDGLALFEERAHALARVLARAHHPAHLEDVVVPGVVGAAQRAAQAL